MCIMQMVLHTYVHFVSQVSVASDYAGYLHILTTLCQKSQESPKRSHELLGLQPSLIIILKGPFQAGTERDGC